MILRNTVQVALLEDLPRGDKTTDSLSFESLNGSARLIAKQDLVISGTEAFAETFRQVDSEVKIYWKFKDGDKVPISEIVCEIKGNLASLLKAERTSLNFLGHLSGIATKTARFSEKVKGTKAKITDTRKTIPGLRFLEKQAVVHGGGTNHRLNLSDAILIKENHIRAAGGISAAVKSIRAKNPGDPIEIEVTNMDEINEALQLKIERVLLDNMSLSEMQRAVKLIDNQTLIEASGNMTLDRIESVAKLGVDFISVGELTHSASNADLSMLFNTETK